MKIKKRAIVYRGINYLIIVSFCFVESGKDIGSAILVSHSVESSIIFQFDSIVRALHEAET